MNKLLILFLFLVLLSNVYGEGGSEVAKAPKYSETIYNVNFVLPDGFVTPKKLNRMRAGHGDVLNYDQQSSEWTPYTIKYPLVAYKGLWDARLESQGGTENPPATNPDNGDFYFVSVAGNTDLDGLSMWDKGDFAIYGPNGWELIDAGNMVSSLNGRTGFVNAAANDIAWTELDRTSSSINDFFDVDVSNVGNGEGLTWNGSTHKWEPAFTEALPGSISSDEMADDAVSTAKIKDESLTNEDFSPTAGIKTSKLNIAEGDLTIAKTNGLQGEIDSKVPITGSTIGGILDLGGNNLVDVGSINDINMSGLQASAAANTDTINNLDTELVAETTPGGPMFFTEERARLAVVEDQISPPNLLIDMAPSQNAVYVALLDKQNVLSSTEDLLISTLTTDSRSAVTIDSSATQAGEIRFYELADFGSDYVALNAPDALPTNIDWTLPGDDGLYGHMLTRKMDGDLMFIDPASIGGIVFDVLATLPVTSSGGATPNISISQASSTSSGYIIPLDWVTFNNKQDGGSTLSAIASITTNAGTFIISDGTNWTGNDPNATKTVLSLDLVENTSLLSWPGSGAITTLGTVTTGTWHGTILDAAYLPIGGNWNLTSDLNFDSGTLVIANDGNVGIGTSGPSAKLDVAGTVKIDSTNFVLQQDASLGAYALGLQATATDGDAKFYYMPSGTSTQSYVRLYNDSDPLNTGAVDLRVNGDTFEISDSVWGTGTAITSTAFMIDSVAIDTNNFDEQMVIGGAMSILESATPTGTLVFGKLFVSSIDSKLYYMDELGATKDMTLSPDNMGDHTATEDIQLDSYLLVGEGGSTGISIDGSGNVGIGTTTPAATLSIKSNLLLGKESDVANGPDILFTGEGLIASESDFYLNFGSIGGGGNLYIGEGTETSAANKLVTVLNNGNVGIGTESPNEKLQVEGIFSMFKSATPAITAGYGKIFVGGAGAEVYYMDSDGNIIDLSTWPDNLGNHIATQNIDLSNNQLVGDGGATGITILNDGNVGIGTTSPSAKLHVIGDIKIDDGVTDAIMYGKNGFEVKTSGTGLGMVIDFEASSTDATPNYVQFRNVDSGGGVPSIQVEGGDPNIDLVIQPKGSGSITINSTATGNIGIGTNIPNELLTVEGELAIAESTADATPPSGFGKLYVKGDVPGPGSSLWFKGDDGTETNLKKKRVVAILYEAQAKSVNAGDGNDVNDTPSYTERTINNSEGDVDEVGITYGAFPVTNFNLAPGRFKIKWFVPAFSVDTHHSVLYKNSPAPAGVAAYGSTGYSQAIGNKVVASSYSIGTAIIEIADASNFSIRHYLSDNDTEKCPDGASNCNIGAAHNLNDHNGVAQNSVYTQIVIERI